MQNGLGTEAGDTYLELEVDVLQVNFNSAWLQLSPIEEKREVTSVDHLVGERIRPK